MILLKKRQYSLVNREPKVLLLYPPEQNWKNTLCKPNGSLAYPALAGVLRRINVDVEIYDACVGNDDDDHQDFFYSANQIQIENYYNLK